MYLQVEGGPIGAIITMAAARIVMFDWSQKYKRMLLDIGLKIPMLTGYVDDGRQVTNEMKPGIRFVEQENKFEYREDWKIEDENSENGERV